MSTRCNVVVQDGNQSICIYRHCDGYPDGAHGVVNTLRKAFKFAWPLPRFEASDFSAAIVAAWKDKTGGNIYIDGHTPLDKPDALAHGDIEYLYIITQSDDKKSLLVTEKFEDKQWSLTQKAVKESAESASG